MDYTKPTTVYQSDLSRYRRLAFGGGSKETLASTQCEIDQDAMFACERAVDILPVGVSDSSSDSVELEHDLSCVVQELSAESSHDVKTNVSHEETDSMRDCNVCNIPFWSDPNIDTDELDRGRQCFRAYDDTHSWATQDDLSAAHFSREPEADHVHLLSRFRAHRNPLIENDVCTCDAGDSEPKARPHEHAEDLLPSQEPAFTVDSTQSNTTSTEVVEPLCSEAVSYRADSIDVCLLHDFQNGPIWSLPMDDQEALERGRECFMDEECIDSPSDDDDEFISSTNTIANMFPRMRHRMRGALLMASGDIDSYSSTSESIDDSQTWFPSTSGGETSVPIEGFGSRTSGSFFRDRDSIGAMWDEEDF
eukprot:TRINITY_DN45491_c0_g1_i1.p1 TRINITY_DN45491_c0_g1~~TRINITY_DN45491_c0_g1_i1.p1  ORF type:complete len:372 (-),score=32.46 TRINITY_DN45491_c0_g1_i1:877-1968(-)